MKFMTYPLALPKDYCTEMRDAAGKTGLSSVGATLRRRSFRAWQSPASSPICNSN